uniref:Putative secreted protein n=1 Tax=Ixodes ricinus TaxID=34613 RepID=A0A6B0U8C0_IXORI
MAKLMAIWPTVTHSWPHGSTAMPNTIGLFEGVQHSPRCQNECQEGTCNWLTEATENGQRQASRPRTI